MEKSDRRSEEETYLWIPLQCLDQTLKAILKCLGLHQDSPATSNQPAEEEEDVITVNDEVIVTSRGIQNRVTVTSRATKSAIKPKRKGKERVSTGRGGQHNEHSS